MAAFDEMLAMMKAVERQEPIRRTDCPQCGWPLEETPWGLHCQFDGWTENIVIKRGTRGDK